MLDEGLEWILISGQLGAEIWAAEVAFSLQEEYPELKVAVITPFFDQEKNWNEKNKELYEAVLAQSDYTESLTHRPYESPAQFKQKNRFFIEKADGLLILYDEEVDGSPVYMLNEAKKLRKSAIFRSIRSQWTILDQPLRITPFTKNNMRKINLTLYTFSEKI